MRLRNNLQHRDKKVINNNFVLSFSSMSTDSTMHQNRSLNIRYSRVVSTKINSGFNLVPIAISLLLMELVQGIATTPISGRCVVRHQQHDLFVSSLCNKKI